MKFKLKPLKDIFKGFSINSNSGGIETSDGGYICREMYHFFGKEVELISRKTYESSGYQYSIYDDIEESYWGIKKEWIDNSYKIDYNELNDLFERGL